MPDKELVTYLLTGLGPIYETFVTLITTRLEPPSSHELFQLLLVHESRLVHTTKQLFDPSANVSFQSSQGGRPQRGRHPFRGRQGRGRGNYPSHGGRSSSNFFGNETQTPGGTRPVCQVCQKMGHVALQCRNRFNHSYQFEAPPSFSTNYTTNYPSPNLLQISLGTQTQRPPITSQTTSATSTYPANSILVMKLSAWVMDRVFQFSTLVNHLFPLPLLLVFICTISFMFCTSQKILSLFLSSA